jgi:methyl-accepting chemotaxis protein
MNNNMAAQAATSVTAMLPRPGANSALSEFFRYHGAWAPGVRLFRALGFRSKALVISAVFMLPIAVLAFSYFADKAAAIGFSAKERLGVAYAREALPLLPALQRQRLLAVQEAAKGEPAAAMAEARGAADAAFKRLAAGEARIGAELGTAKAYAALLDKAKGLPAASAGGEKVLAAHNALVQALLDLLTTATDNSNLTLDPDVDTYYLMDGSLSVLPTLLEATSRLRDMSNALLNGLQPSADFMKQAAAQEAISGLTEDRWEAGVDKVVTVHARFKDELGVAGVRKALQDFHKTAASSESPAKLVAEGNSALDALLAAQVKSLGKLDELIAARIAGLEASRNLTGGVLALSLLAAWYLFVSFRKVLDGGLREVAFHINAMRDGDLTTHPRAWGADEAARLMQTLSDMQSALRRIVTQVRGASDSIVTASTEISGGALDLSSRTEQSAANLQQTAAAMEEISATVRSNEDTVSEATKLATANAQVAERGGQIIGQVVATMQQINVSSSRIGDIIGTIDSIAFQTNILALNAAVEAARAGEQGRGFAVVASEVRALAQRSGAAAREIKSLITTSMEQVEGGTRVVREAGSTIDEIVGTSRRVRELLNSVAAGAREQTQGIAQSASAVQELDTVTQQNAALVEETAAAAGSLKDQAHALAGEVAQFKLPR